MSYHRRDDSWRDPVDEPLIADFDDDGGLAACTAQFAMSGGLTEGQRRGYDASWFRVRGDRHGDDGGKK